MKTRYLEVTYRKGRPMAAYLYLPRISGAKSARTERMGTGILVDFSAEGTPIGVEITAPQLVTVEDINRVLEQVGQPRLDAGEWAPIAA